MGNNMSRLEQIVAELPETLRVDIDAWDGHPTFRVQGKNFVFSDSEAARLTVKLIRDEAAAVIATEPGAVPAGYGLGCHGWVAFDLTQSENVSWDHVREWIRTSYMLVAPKKLARMALAEESSIRGDAS